MDYQQANEVSISKLAGVMMRYYNDTRLSEHALKVYAYSRCIGAGEQLPANEMLILCAASILHDIGIPKALELYGSAMGEYQETEGALLAPGMLEEASVQPDIFERVVWLVGHHHTAALADSDMLLQILMEADYLVNLAEGNCPAEDIKVIRDGCFKTPTGIQYIEALFGLLAIQNTKT